MKIVNPNLQKGFMFKNNSKKNKGKLWLQGLF